MSSHEEDFMSPRIQAGKNLAVLLTQAQGTLARLETLVEELRAHRQQVLQNPNGIFQPGDLAATTAKMIAFRNAIQAFAASLDSL